jgi:hypothetical protein
MAVTADARVADTNAATRLRTRQPEGAPVSPRRRVGGFSLRGANRLAKRGGDIWTKGGAATGALIGQRLGTVFIVGMQPTHHGLRSSSRAFGNRRGTTACRDLVQRQKAFAAAGMRGTQGRMAWIRNRLVPALMINS